MSTREKLLLGYSTNVHRGEALDQVYEFLRRWTVPIARRLFGNREAGLELRIGMGSARELKRPRALEEFREFLGENGLVPFSVNAFPLLDFHATRVKEKVYLPAWDDRERSRWTNVIAGILADLLPDGVTGTVSTLGGKFRPSGNAPSTLRKVAAGYLRTVRELVRIEERTGKTVILAVEPEPDTTFETARDVIDFFERYLLPLARRSLSTSGPRSERLLRKFFTVNFDTCHFSVLFEDLIESLDTLEAAGLRVGKVHVTSALSLKNPFRAPLAYRQFRQMHEPRYFHQFCGRGRDGTVVWRGLHLNRLPPVLSKDKHPDVVELRSHYHVPLYRKTWNRLATTREETRALVQEIVRRRLCSQLVIETYTWPILEREGLLEQGIAREFSWLLGVLGKAGPPRELRKPRRKR